MKFRTAQQRRARKTRKAVELREKTTKRKQIHASFHNKLGYHGILAKVREKTSLQTIRNESKKRGHAKLLLVPSVIWDYSLGTYTKAKHGELR